jgi:hypothetical protein
VLPHQRKPTPHRCPQKENGNGAMRPQPQRRHCLSCIIRDAGKKVNQKVGGFPVLTKVGFFPVFQALRFRRGRLTDGLTERISYDMLQSQTRREKSAIICKKQKIL